MLRLVLIMCLTAFVAVSQVFAQQMEDVVHLKNGGIVRGTIVEQIPGESLKIQTRDGNVFVFAMDEIARLSKDFAGDTSSSASVKAEIGTLFALRHLRYSSYRGDTFTVNTIRVPNTLSVWLIPTEMVAIGSDIAFASNDTDVDFLLTGKVAFSLSYTTFSPSYPSTTGIYVLGTGSLDYSYDSEINAGLGMGLRTRVGSVLVLRVEGRYERRFEDEANVFSLLFGLGTQVGG